MSEEATNYPHDICLGVKPVDVHQLEGDHVLLVLGPLHESPIQLVLQVPQCGLLLEELADLLPLTFLI